MRKRDPFAIAVAAIAAIFLLCFLFWPLAESLRGAFFDPSGAPTLAFVILLFQNPIYIEGFVNALGVAAASTAARFGHRLPGGAFFSIAGPFPGKSLIRRARSPFRSWCRRSWERSASSSSWGKRAR